jgi:transposase-like protein
MSQPTTKTYPAEFKERAVKLAVEAEQPIAQTARDLGINCVRSIDHSLSRVKSSRGAAYFLSGAGSSPAKT